MKNRIDKSMLFWDRHADYYAKKAIDSSRRMMEITQGSGQRPAQCRFQPGGGVRPSPLTGIVRGNPGPERHPFGGRHRTHHRPLSRVVEAGRGLHLQHLVHCTREHVPEVAAPDRRQIGSDSPGANLRQRLSQRRHGLCRLRDRHERVVQQNRQDRVPFRKEVILNLKASLVLIETLQAHSPFISQVTPSRRVGRVLPGPSSSFQEIASHATDGTFACFVTPSPPRTGVFGNRGPVHKQRPNFPKKSSYVDHA